MILSTKKYVAFNLKELLVKGNLIIGVLAALGPAILMSYYILAVDNTSFYIKHVSNFYCMLGMLAAVLHPLYFINRDYSSKTISLINNSKQNRKKYVWGNITIASIISLIYAIIGIVLLLVTKKLGVPGELEATFLLGFFVDVFLLVLTFFLFGYILLLYGVRSSAVYVILTALLLFIHNILGNILGATQNGFITALIKNFPGYFYPVMVGSNPLSPLQYTIGFITLIIFFYLVFKKSERIEM